MSTTSPYPQVESSGSLFLAYQLRSKSILLIGGGQVGASRLYHLLCAQPKRIVLVSRQEGLSDETKYYLERYGIDYPKSSQREQGGGQRNDVDQDEEERIVEWRDRNYEVGDEEPFDMVLTAIDSPGLSSQICQRCRTLKIPVNVADVPPECDFYFGSTLRSGSLSVMVSTNGKGPRLAARLRRRLESSIPRDAGRAIENVGKLRMALRRKVSGGEKEVIDRRMEWMSRVCDRWSIAQLRELDDRMIDEVLQGWEKGEAKGYWDVNRRKWGGLGYIASWASWIGVGSCPVKKDPDGRASRCPFVMGTTGMVTGIAVAVAAAKVLHYSQRR